MGHSSLLAFLLIVLLASGTGCGAAPEQAPPSPTPPAEEKKEVPATWHKIDFVLEGAGCMVCVRKLEREMRQVPGVVQVSVIVGVTRVLSVIHDTAKVNVNQLTEMIKKQGFGVASTTETAIKELPPLPKDAGAAHASDAPPPVAPPMKMQ